LGHLPWFLPDRLGFLTRCAAAYGDVVKLRIGEPTYLLTRAEDIQHVLIDQASNYEKTWRLTSERGKRLSGSGMHTMVGAAHLRQRRLLQPEFHRRVMEGLVPMMLERAAERVSGWRDGQRLDLAAEMESLTLSILIEALFGPGFRDRELEEAITVRRRFIEYMYGSLLPYPEYWPLPLVRRYAGAMHYIDGVIRREIRQPSSPLGFAARLRELRDSQGVALREDQVRDEVLTLTSTGYETIGDGLSWTFYLLARHRDVEARVREELNGVSAGLFGGRIAVAGDLAPLVYTRQVVNESLRLYPPTWIFVRMALGDDTLPSGTVVKRGDKLYLSQYVVHRHPRYYAEPERFDPDRFTPAEVAKRPRLAYFPFGAGQRLCIGDQFALLQMTAVLARVVPEVWFEVTEDRVVAQPGVTLRPRDGIAAVVRRNAVLRKGATR
jgi:cytochrome P450